MNLLRLRRTLNRCFDENELRDLCFDLGVDYQDLPGEGKGAKVRELIAHLERRGRLPKLVEMGRELRPDVSWEDISAGIPEAAVGKAVQAGLRRPGCELRFAVALSLLLVLGAAILGRQTLWDVAAPILGRAPTPVPPTATVPPPTPTAPPPTATVLLPSPTMPRPSPTPSLPVVEFVHIEHDPEGSDLEGEYVLLRNTTEVSQDLTAWTIEDSDGHVFRFESFVLEPAASVKVWTGAGEDTGTDVYWGYGRGLWDNDGDTATLKDYRGQVVDTFNYSP
jgi:hypothetical protein